MRVFLDSSVLLAACGSRRGASRSLFAGRGRDRLELVTSEWCLVEVERNLPVLGSSGARTWRRIVPRLKVIRTELVLDRPLVLSAAKDRPVLISALAARCEALLTLDRVDFPRRLGPAVYGMRLMTPGEWLRENRGVK